MLDQSSELITLPLALHIGYHKTATTYLQEYVFNSHPEIIYLGFPWINKKLNSFFVRYKFSHDIDYQPDLFRKNFSSIIRNILEEKTYEKGQYPDPKLILVSNEGLHNKRIIIPRKEGLVLSFFSYFEKLKQRFNYL